MRTLEHCRLRGKGRQLASGVIAIDGVETADVLPYAYGVTNSGGYRDRNKGPALFLRSWECVLRDPNISLSVYPSHKQPCLTQTLSRVSRQPKPKK